MVRIVATLWVLLLCLGSSLSISAQQDSLKVSKNFKFKDGIYTSFQDFRNNKPRFSFDQVQAQMSANPQSCMAQITHIAANNHEIPIDSIWGICLSGIPYIQLADKSHFACLSVRGKICLYSYATQELRRIPMPVYNPATGSKLYEGVVERVVDKDHTFMLHFETGETKGFSPKNFKEWIKGDVGLYNSIDDLDVKETREKLFKCLLIYDDRNPVFVKQ